MKKNSILTVICLLVVALFVASAIGLVKIGFVDRLSWLMYDYRLQLTMPETVDERIVILDIDDKSLKEEGRWPWRRDQLAQLTDRLFDHYQVSVAAFDVVFAESDHSSGLQVLQQLQAGALQDNDEFNRVMSEIRPRLQYDHIFADSLRGRPVVLGYYFLQQETHRSGALPPPVLSAQALDSQQIWSQHWEGYGANLPLLQQAAVSAGHFNPIVDDDGVVRRVPLLVEHQGGYYESLSLAVVRTLLGQPEIAPGVAGDYGAIEWLALETEQYGRLTIPVDEQLSAQVPYRGEQGSFRYYSLSDILHARVPIEALKGKIVLIGTTALGLVDMRATPVAEVFPGVEIHANLVAGILDQEIKSRPGYMLGAEVLWLLLAGLVLSLLLPRLSAYRALILCSVSLLLTAGLSLWLWQYAQLQFKMADFLVMLSILFVINISYGYLFESRAKRQITGLFGHYVPSELVDEMVRRPEAISMKGESRELSVLFSDVRGFTSISEGLEPQELAALMNEFLTPLSRVIHRQRGTIDKYMGDCIMAFWGAPLPDEAHARHAIRAGLNMLKRLDELQPEFQKRGWPRIEIGVGINSGRMSVGNMGSEIRVAYTVMGDEVNLASRLEGITKQYGVGIIVGENTFHQVPDFAYRELDQVRVKGKDRPVTIYEPVIEKGLLSEEKQQELDLFHQMRRCYCQQQWLQADELLKQLQQLGDCKLYQVYAERIEYFRHHPPGEDWDGVFVFNVK